MLDQPGQLIGRSVDGLVQGRCLVSDHDWLAAFEAGFHHAALFVLAVRIAVFVAQMNLHSRDVIANPAQRTLHYFTDLGGQRLVTFDVMVGIDLYLHWALRLPSFLKVSWLFYLWSSAIFPRHLIKTAALVRKQRHVALTA
jgi:hypothetical protein